MPPRRQKRWVREIGLLGVRHSRGATRLSKNRVKRYGALAMVLGQEPIHIDASRTNGERITSRHNLKAVGRFLGHAAAADEVRGLSTPAPVEDGSLFVPVCIELHTPLLHQHSAEMSTGVKALPTVIATHSLSPGWVFR